MNTGRLCAFSIVISLAVACGDSGSDGGGSGTGGSGASGGKGGTSAGGKGGSGGATGGSGGATGGAGGSVAGAGGALGGSAGQAGSGGGVTDAGLDGPASKCAPLANKTISSLTADEIKLLCDCVAELLGGYGSEVKCGAQTIKAKASQQTCIDSYQALDCSAGEAVQCTQELAVCNLNSAVCEKYTQCALADAGG
jgi:hypothetical protein